MKLSFSLAFLVAVVACELPRPQGAYYPPDTGAPAMIVDAARDPDAVVNIPTFTGGGAPGGGGGTPSGGTTGTVILPGDAGGGGDAGIVADGDSGAPIVVDPEVARLSPLVGRYLMRMDMMSKVTVNAGLGGTVVTNNRVSHLLVTQVYFDETQTPPRLMGSERLCYQTFEHRCLSGCMSLTTTMSPAVVNELVTVDPASRAYTIVAGGTQLSTDTTKLLLGFDASQNPVLPTSDTDPRVWDTIPGGVREGVLLSLSLKQSLFVNVDCQVYTTQSFSSSFTGDLASSAQGVSLETSFDVTASGDGKTLDATDPSCAGSDSSTSDDLGDTVRFAKLADNAFSDSDFWGCPDQNEWDSRLAPPSPPTQ